ncbi:M15 family metallopeptidase [Candidatus Parcubacteria bacterium]|nr:M15 family metallopeptidase [Candidatus Parcubacteria bacterium]
MENFRELHKRLDGWPLVAVVGVLLCVLAFYAHAAIKGLERDNVDTLADLERSRADKYVLLHELREKEGTINEFQGQLQDLGQTVGTLKKLANTDKELLQKYSKVYFLSENYIPTHTVEIDKEYVSPGATNYRFLADAAPFLERLLRDSRASGTGLLVASAFRSFGTQAALKSSYKVTYGSGANSFSADQGYSEHQLGTALDFTTDKLGPAFSTFDKESAYKWLQENAYKYGFILSYPKGNAYYTYEPWHWRFVGVALATKLHSDGDRFYDLDQREIDAYLVKLFD